MTEIRWQPLPDAASARLELGPVEPGLVVGVGALCDVGPQGVEGRDASFSVSEFVAVQDGRRITLHQGRGFTIGWRSTGQSGAIRGRMTREQMTQHVLNTVLPDDDESGEEHPWSWLAGLARARGLNVTADDLRGLPYQVIFTENVQRWLEAP